jgi:Cu+-exporting ATPase
VDTIVLDKTGTLTTAQAGGVRFVALKSPQPQQLDLIGSLARHSTHPHSLRIARSISFTPLSVTGFKETPGCGIEGRVGEHTVWLGSCEWVTARASESQASSVRGIAAVTVNDPDRNGPSANPLRAEDSCDSAGAVWVAVNGRISGAFTFQNALRPEVQKLVAELGGRFEVALLSGDNEREAACFRNIFGASATLRFNQSPADKLEFIRELQQRGRKVMMVGDGLNDAGALKQADVGVAVVEQVGTFSPASDVILDAAELPKLARVMTFCRQATRVVHAGFIISSLYNLVGVSIAAAGMLSPVVCAVLMPVSSATVVFFACGATFWVGKKLQAGAPDAAILRRDVQPPAFNLQPLMKEVA